MIMNINMKNSFILGIFVIAILFTSCSQAAGEKEKTDGISGAVNTEGSTSMADLMAVLQECFREKEPGVTVNCSGTGSGAGIEAVLAGTCDIGLSSRELAETEIRQGAQAHLIALDGVALVVHAGNPVSDLSMPQIAAVFTGEITNWKELGGENAPIAAYGREAGSGTRAAFESVFGITDLCRYRNEYGSTGDVIGNVSSNPNAIGYASLSSVREGVAVVKVDGADCTEENVRNGVYAVRRPFIMVTKKGVPLTDAAQSFLDYAQSSEAAVYIPKAGAIAP